MAIIYIIKNKINDKVYIGQTNKSAGARFSTHKYFAETKQNKCLKIERAINKYGPAQFYIEIITAPINQTDTNFWEKFYIKLYNSIENGYNIKEGGGSGPLPQSVKDKISAAQFGEKNHMFGKHLSDKTKQKMSNKLSGENHPLHGTHRSDQTKRLIGAKSKGRECFWKGKSLPEGTADKISITRKENKIAVGENNPAAKLTLIQVEEIRLLIPHMKYKDIASKYGVSESTIQRIKSGDKWKN